MNQGVTSVAAAEECVLRLLLLQRGLDHARGDQNVELANAAAGLVPRMLQVLEVAKKACSDNRAKLEACCQEVMVPTGNAPLDPGGGGPRLPVLHRGAEPLPPPKSRQVTPGRQHAARVNNHPKPEQSPNCDGFSTRVRQRTEANFSTLLSNMGFQKAADPTGLASVAQRSVPSVDHAGIDRVRIVGWNSLGDGPQPVSDGEPASGKHSTSSSASSSPWPSPRSVARGGCEQVPVPHAVRHVRGEEADARNTDDMKMRYNGARADASTASERAPRLRATLSGDKYLKILKSLQAKSTQRGNVTQLLGRPGASLRHQSSDSESSDGSARKPPRLRT